MRFYAALMFFLSAELLLIQMVKWFLMPGFLCDARQAGANRRGLDKKAAEVYSSDNVSGRLAPFGICPDGQAERDAGMLRARSGMIEDMDDVGLPSLSRTQMDEILSVKDETRLDAALNRILAASKEGDCHGFTSHIAS